MTTGAMIYFVRHGESEANVRGVFANRSDDHALTERGRQQTLALAAKLRSCGIGRIYTNPVRRAREPALH